MKNTILKPVLLAPRGWRPGLTKPHFTILILIFVENCLLYDGIHSFSVWLITSSNPADINRCQSHTGKLNLVLPFSSSILHKWSCIWFYIPQLGSYQCPHSPISRLLNWRLHGALVSLVVVATLKIIIYILKSLNLRGTLW